MFADQFFPQLIFFLFTQVAAFGLLRTGMLVWGFSVLILGWILGDLALILHFVFPGEVTAYLSSLWGLQVLALVSCTVFFGWRWIRRREGFRVSQEECYSEALDHFMAGRDEEAKKLFRRLSKRDPWDVEALLLLGRLEVVQHGGGAKLLDRRSTGRAMRRMRLSHRLSGESPIAMEIEEEIRCLKRRAKSPAQAKPPRPELPKRQRSVRKAAS